jgi:hypothetical protein
MASKIRGLTRSEIELLREVFGNRISYERVRLREGAGGNPLARIALSRPGNWAMTYLHTVYFNDGRFRDDFAAPGEDAALLIHEAAHVWQYSKLGLLAFAARYGWNFVSCRFDQHRLYDYEEAPHFKDATLEGQAQMLGDYYKARKGTGGEVLKAKLAATGFYGLD